MIKDRFTVIRTKEYAERIEDQCNCINNNNGYCMKLNITCMFRYMSACVESEYYWNLKVVK